MNVINVEIIDCLVGLVSEENDESSLILSRNGVSHDGAANTDLNPIIFEEMSLVLEASNSFSMIVNVLNEVVVLLDQNSLALLVGIVVVEVAD